MIGMWTWVKLGALAALVGGAVFWHANQLSDAREEGLKSGRQSVQAAWDQEKLEKAQAENRGLLTQQERIIELTSALQELQSAHSKTKDDLADARAAARSRGERLQHAVGPSLDERLGAATCDVSRTFAAGSFRTAKACRDDIEKIGLHPGGLVESSASAHYEHGRAEALLKFTMPRLPNHKKDQP